MPFWWLQCHPVSGEQAKLKVCSVKACNVGFWLMGSWCHVFTLYSYHQTSGWLIESKMIAWKPICQDISFWPSRSNPYTLPWEFDRKVWCEISFHNLVSRLLLLFLWWARGLVMRNRHYTTALQRHATLPHLQNGIAKSLRDFWSHSLWS